MTATPAPALTDRTAATDAEFAARIAAFDAAEYPAEVAQAAVVEEVARAIADAQDAHGPFYFPCKCGWEAEFGAGWEDRGRQHRLTSVAVAAIAAYRATQDGGAVKATLTDVAEDLEWAATKQDNPDVALGFTAAAGRVRERLDDMRAAR
jgi:hypothetical protein